MVLMRLENKANEVSEFSPEKCRKLSQSQRFVPSIFFTYVEFFNSVIEMDVSLWTLAL